MANKDKPTDGPQAQKSRKDQPKSNPAAKSTANHKPSPKQPQASPKQPQKDDAAKIWASKRSAVPRLQNSRKDKRGERGLWVRGNRFEFPKGVSGNPSGRPKNMRHITERYRHRLAQVNPSDPQGRTNGELIADAVLTAALKGNFKAILELTDRVEGPKKALPVEAPSPLQSEEWVTLRHTIVVALEPFPDARDAVLRAIDENSEDSYADQTVR